MDDRPRDESASPKRMRLAIKVGLVGAGIVAGAIGATAIAASADTGSSGTPSASSTSSAAAPRAHDHGGSSPVRGDEKSLSADLAAKIKAAALKAVPGGTVYRVETDAGDAAYEAHMTKSDGSDATVKFDKNLKVTGVESGMGKGDPAPGGMPGMPGGQGGPPPDGQH